MLRKTLLAAASWLVGILGMVGIFLYYWPKNFSTTLDALGVVGITGWVVLTLLARLCANEATVVPLAALGFRLTRPDAFWISWIRTFANQIAPIIGAAAYVQLIRRHTGIAWSQVAALGQPQLLLVAAAIGIVGLLATAVSYPLIGTAAVGLATLYAVIVVFSLAFATGAHWLLESLPKGAAARVIGTSDALRTMARSPKLITRLLVVHGVAVILRGGKLWFLFAAAGVRLDPVELLLLIAIAESSLLLNITPGALGVREGAILAGAGLLHIPAATASSVALIDRLFMFAITTLLAAPAFAIVRRPKTG